MTPVPASPDPESRPPGRPATGRRRAPAVPALSIGRLDDVCAGSLLVAMPSLTDPTFAGTVVYVLDHSDTGTLGVVLGRPSQVEIRDVLPGWSDLAVPPGVFHVGGPCESDTALCLAIAPGAAADETSPLRRVAGDVYLVDLDADPADLPEQLTGLRVFAGYAGWSPGQLEEEIATGSWLTFKALPSDAFTERPDDLWAMVLRRQGGMHAAIAIYPSDPTLN
jgi:putative AlgH/UPF0301 family transcriptional regulator